LYTDKKHREIIEKYLDEEEIELDEKEKREFNRLVEYRTAVYDGLDAHPTIRDNWFRIIYSSQPFPPKLVARVNEYNMEHPYTPLILISICDKLVSFMDALKGLESTKYISNPRDPRLEHIIDDTVRKIDRL